MEYPLAAYVENSHFPSLITCVDVDQDSLISKTNDLLHENLRSRNYYKKNDLEVNIYEFGNTYLSIYFSVYIHKCERHS